MHIMSILAHDSSSSSLYTHRRTVEVYPLGGGMVVPAKPHFLLYLFPNVGTFGIRARRAKKSSTAEEFLFGNGGKEGTWHLQSQSFSPTLALHTHTH